MKKINLLSILITGLLGGCTPSPPQTHQQSNNNVEIEVFVDKINKIKAEYPVSIPKSKWTDLFKDFKFVRIYNHRANIAVVLSESETSETGIYIYQKVSSYFPGTNNKYWKFGKIGEDIWAYTHIKAEVLKNKKTT